jgi:hypothetical protein
LTANGSADCRFTQIAVSQKVRFCMSMRMKCVNIGLLSAMLSVASSRAQEPQFDLPAMGGFAVSNDNSTLVVSLTAKTSLVYFDTKAGKEAKRVTVEFQPTQLAWDGKFIFAAQKSSGQVHILDAASGKELAVGNAGGPVRNLAMAKGICFASTDSRQVFAIDAKGKSTKTSASGSFIAADPKGAFVCTVIDGRARTDVMKFNLDGKELQPAGTLQGKVGGSLQNVQAVRVSGDGKLVGVVAGGGWMDVDRKRHYGIPLYSTADMATQVGDLETGAYPSGCTFHPVLPIVFACTGKEGQVFSAKSFAPNQKIMAPREGATVVLAFVSRGQKLAWGISTGTTSTLKFFDLELTDEQRAELDKVFSGK